MLCAGLNRFSYELDILDKYGLPGLKPLGHSLDSVRNLHQMLDVSYGEERFCDMATSTSQSAACSSYLWGKFFYLRNINQQLHFDCTDLCTIFLNVLKMFKFLIKLRGLPRFENISFQPGPH